MDRGRFRRLVALSLLCVIALGISFKFYSGPWRWWPNDYGAGLWYEVFWVLLASFVFPAKRSRAAIPCVVCAATICLEFAQLWHPAFLEPVRATFPGSALIGATFSWWDLPHYVAGSFLGWCWVRIIAREGMRNFDG